MSRNILNIVTQSLFRRRNNWSLCSLPARSPDYLIFSGESTIIISTIKKLLIQRNKNGFNNSPNWYLLNSLLGIKLNMDDSPWPNPNSLPLKSKEWLEFDLLTLINLSYLLIESISLLKYQCKDIPSYYASSIHYQDHLLSKGNITTSNNINLKLIASCQLSNLIDKLITLTYNDSSVYHNLNRLISCPPSTYSEEQYYITIITTYLYYLGDSNMQDLDPESVQLGFLISLGYLRINEAIDLIDCYCVSLFSKESIISQYRKILLFWKSQKKFISSIMPDHMACRKNCIRYVNLIIEFLNDQYKLSNLNSIPSHPDIIWNDRPFEFAKLFHTFLLNKSLSINGHYDIEPFVRSIHKFIAIKKDKGEGYLSYSSLLTYFKQLNSDIY